MWPSFGRELTMTGEAKFTTEWTSQQWRKMSLIFCLNPTHPSTITCSSAELILVFWALANWTRLSLPAMTVTHRCLSQVWGLVVSLLIKCLSFDRQLHRKVLEDKRVERKASERERSPENTYSRPAKGRSGGRLWRCQSQKLLEFWGPVDQNKNSCL